MSGTLDRIAALRLAARELRRRSMELQSRGQFIDAQTLHEAHVELVGLRFTLDPRVEELEATGGDARHGS